MKIIDGGSIKKYILASIQRDWLDLAGGLAFRPKPSLSTVCFAEEAPSIRWAQSKMKDLNSIGFDTEVHVLPLSADIGRRQHNQAILQGLVGLLNRDESKDGILIQYPLPAGFNCQQKDIESLIASNKNVDAVHYYDCQWENLSADYLLKDLSIRPIPGLILEEIVRRTTVDMASAKVVLSGVDPVTFPSLLAYLKSKMRNLANLQVFEGLPEPCQMPRVREADLFVTCNNKPGSFSLDYFKEGASVVDFGYGCVHGKQKGDVLWDYRSPARITLSPSPGGPGMLIGAGLARNVYTNWKRKAIASQSGQRQSKSG
jgi:methylenetetrahydrofolate dehydrogenase (NADP+)/methenyltetrahydrofolate cyclohydrolase